MTITISIDDVHPQKGWRILGDTTETWLRKLHEDFGAKFTCFVPSNYHGKFPLSEHKEWVQELNSIPWIELAAHGHLHMTSDVAKFGECEFAEIATYQPFLHRISDMYSEWETTGYIPIGWKSPGWLCSPISCKLLNVGLSRVTESGNHPLWKPSYVSLHYEHNRGLQWTCKTFFGHDGIEETNISVHNSRMVMLTSHISGDWNKNVWNERNYEQLRLSLAHLYITENCNFKT